MNKRFPELENARKEFLGKDPDRSPNKKLHANELVKFSQVVYNLSQEQDPHPYRVATLNAQS